MLLLAWVGLRGWVAGVLGLAVALLVLGWVWGGGAVVVAVVGRG